MEHTIRLKSLKDYETNFKPYYAKEIVPYSVERRLFEPKDVGRLGTSATTNGMGTVRTDKLVTKYIVNFLSKATIHGLNHIVAPHRHFIERILTILFVGSALGCLVVSALVFWYQYQNYPTIMVLDFDYKNFNVTKPAITICMIDTLDEDKFQTVFKKHGVEDTKEARDFFRFISKPSYVNMEQTPIYNGTPPDKWLEIVWDMSLNYKTDECKISVNCAKSKITVDVVTELGICKTVNGAYSDYMSPAYWIANNWTIVPEIPVQMYKYVFRDDRISIKHMVLHYPMEVPVFDDSWQEMIKTEMLDLKIDVQELASSDDLKALSKSQRPCNFPENGNLKMWPIYTYNMCMLECKFNFMKSKCGCYPYFARPMPGTPICNATQSRCIGNIWALMTSAKTTWEHVCKCPGNCNTASYLITSSARLNLATGTKTLSDRPVNIDLIFPFTKLRHEVSFGFNEFLVSVGGAAGLFLGASIISFVEILYYAILRIFWYRANISRQRYA